MVDGEGEFSRKAGGTLSRARGIFLKTTRGIRSGLTARNLANLGTNLLFVLTPRRG